MSQPSAAAEASGAGGHLHATSTAQATAPSGSVSQPPPPQTTTAAPSGTAGSGDNEVAYDNTPGNDGHQDDEHVEVVSFLSSIHPIFKVTRRGLWKYSHIITSQPT
jgi:hypothetical protein